MFDPALKGYWGTEDIAAAMDTVLDIVRAHAQKIEGIKISLLDAQWEVAMRRRLPAGVIMFTGDDFNYDTLIAGDGTHHSHVLLGIFDPISKVFELADRCGVLIDPELAVSRMCGFLQVHAGIS